MGPRAATVSLASCATAARRAASGPREPRPSPWRVPQPDAVGTALVGAGLQADRDLHWRLVRDSENKDEVVTASLHLDEEELTVKVNSRERPLSSRSQTRPNVRTDDTADAVAAHT
ncbi:MAG: hypothetical protein ABWZ26_02795 [Candidatus Nanopelagicales bacterium]